MTFKNRLALTTIVQLNAEIHSSRILDPSVYTSDEKLRELLRLQRQTSSTSHEVSALCWLL